MHPTCISQRDAHSRQQKKVSAFLLKSGGFRLIMSMEFFILALRFLKSEKIQKKVALFPFRSYKEMQGKKLAKAVTFFVRLRIRK